MASLILGPMLRYVGATDATLWVETDAPCEVEVLGHRGETFCVAGHHYALIYMTDLAPATTYEYRIHLDGESAWPLADSPFPPSVIRTFDGDNAFRLAFGSCRVAVPQEPPYTRTQREDKQGYEIDALLAYVTRMLGEPAADWPHALLLLGDQIYADDVSPAVREFIRARRDTAEPPGEELADFEEYTRLYHDSWSEPSIRWLLSVVPSAMIFDDHDVNDDWNTSQSWIEDMRAKPWWNERIVGGFMSYWIYQHLGNLSPRELFADPMFQRVRDGRPDEDLAPRLREFAFAADRDPETYRWSFYRDFGRTRLMVIDCRAGRVLAPGRRDMLDPPEWTWVEQHVRGDFDHVLLGTSLPVLMGPGIHYLEAWNEAVCDGAWGGWAARQGEKIRRLIDLEHWSAFQTSFDRITRLIRSIATGECGKPPGTVTMLSGDVHHVYLAKARFNDNSGVESGIYQAVCSPFRNPLDANTRRVMRACWRRSATTLTRFIARLAGVSDPRISWQLTHPEPMFDNQIGTLEITGREVLLRFRKSIPGDYKNPRLEQVLEQRLSDE